jgi:purine-binding chemotaxis protein CheW
VVDAPAVTPSAPAEAQPVIRACLFMLAGSPFAVDVRSAREVAIFDDITVLPRAPAPLIGVANLRGTVIPIVDVRPLLGLPVQRLGRSLRTLIVRDGAIQVALAVEGVLGLEPFEEIMPLDDTVGAAHREFDLGLLKWGDGQATLLDAGKIVQALSRQMRGDSRATGDSV